MPSFIQIVKQLPALVEKEKTEWEQAIADYRNKSTNSMTNEKRKIGFIIPDLEVTEKPSLSK